MEPYIAFSEGPEHPSPMRHTATSQLATPDPLSDEEKKRLVVSFLRTGGNLSAVQLDAIALMRKAHEEGFAHIDGDGTGAGKGRTLVGAVFNSWMQDLPHRIGSWRAVYFSTAKVFDTVERDVAALKLPNTVVLDLRTMPKAHIPTHMNVIVFVSHLMLAGKNTATYDPTVGPETNAEWVRRFIRGCVGQVPVIVDESHHIKNCHGNSPAASAVAAMQLLTDVRDKIRLVFASATFASKLEDLRIYAPFVGFVGDDNKSAFSGFERLVGKIGNNKDASNLEFVSAELIRTGRMVSRALSYEGVVFSEDIVTMSDEWRKRHDAAAEVFENLRNLNVFKGKERLGMYYASSLRFFKSHILSGKVERTIELTRAKLAEGRQVIISMMGTGEAATGRALKAGPRPTHEDDGDGEQTSVADAGIRDTLNALADCAEKYIYEDNRTTFVAREHASDLEQLYVSAPDPDIKNWVGSWVVVDRMNDSNAGTATCLEGIVGKVVEANSREKILVKPLCGLARNQGLPQRMFDTNQGVWFHHRELRGIHSPPTNDGFLNSLGFQLHAIRREIYFLHLPDASPLDELKNALGGSSQVAELTGRSTFMERNAAGRWQKVEEATKDVQKERKSFQSGEKKVAVLSLAMSTGTSLHAEGPDGKKRCQILFEMPWSAEKAMQQIGRAHRSDQTSTPEYILMACDRGPDARFLATVASRLRALGAMQSGDRETLMSESRLRLRGADGLDAEHFVSTRAHDAVCKLFTTRAYGQLFEKMGLRETDSLSGKRFLNRALALPCAEADAIFAAFVDGVHEAIAVAEQQGVMSEPIANIVVDGTRNKLVKTMFSPKLKAEIRVFRMDYGLTLEAAVLKREELIRNGNAEAHVYFAEHAGAPCLVWWRTLRTFVRFMATGQQMFGNVDYLPEALTVDEHFEKKWKAAYDEYEDGEPRIKMKRVLMLPALRTLAVLDTPKTIRLAKLAYPDGKKTVGVDLLSNESSFISDACLTKHGFATAEEHEGKGTCGEGAAAASEATTSHSVTVAGMPSRNIVIKKVPKPARPAFDPMAEVKARRERMRAQAERADARLANLERLKGEKIEARRAAKRKRDEAKQRRQTTPPSSPPAQSGDARGGTSSSELEEGEWESPGGASPVAAAGAASSSAPPPTTEDESPQTKKRRAVLSALDDEIAQAESAEKRIQDDFERQVERLRLEMEAKQAKHKAQRNEAQKCASFFRRQLGGGS